jgi:hypothetical protein
MSIGLDISIAALGVSAIGATVAVLNHTVARRKRLEDKLRSDFIEARGYLKAERGKLAKAAIAAQGRFQSDQDIPLLTQPGWIPSRPLSLSEVPVHLREARPEELDSLIRARSRLRSYWPRGNAGSRLTRYSQAIVEYDSATRIEDRPCFRLVGTQFDPLLVLVVS